jgi:hypothetical protein
LINESCASLGYILAILTNVSPCRSQPAKSVEALLSERYDALFMYISREKTNSSIFTSIGILYYQSMLLGYGPGIGNVQGPTVAPETLTALASQWGLGAKGALLSCLREMNCCSVVKLGGYYVRYIVFQERRRWRIACCPIPPHLSRSRSQIRIIY